MHISLLTLICTLAIIISTTHVTYAQNKQSKKNGFTLTAGDLSPLGLGIFDEQHLQLGMRLGYRKGKLQPFIMADYARISGEINELDYEYDNFNDREIQTTRKNKASASLFTVGAGLKYLFSQPKAQTVTTHFTGAIFTFIPVVEAILRKRSLYRALIRVMIRPFFSRSNIKVINIYQPIFHGAIYK